jgi:hypothetical protein
VGTIAGERFPRTGEHLYDGMISSVNSVRNRFRRALMIKRLLPLLLVLSIVLPCALAKKNAQWIVLFNGKNLDGWTPKFAKHELGENYRNTFRVEDGLLKVSYDQWDRFNGEFGHLFYKDKFSNYRIRVEYRFVGKQVPGGPDWALLNSGIMVHCQPPQTVSRDQEFPVSIEAQILGDDGSGKRTDGNVCTPGTNIVMNGRLITEHCTVTSKKTFPVNQWVTMEVEVHGNGVIKHVVNGGVVSKYEKAQYDPRDEDAKKLITSDNLMISEGYISLQAESHPIEFRKVELQVLDGAK